MALKKRWLWLPAFERFADPPVLTDHLSDLILRRQTKRARAAEARLRTPGVAGSLAFTLGSGSGFGGGCHLSAHLFHKLAHGRDVTW